MTHEVIEKDVPEVLVAAVVEHVPMTEAGAVIPAAFRALSAAVEPVGYGDGMPGVIYHQMDPASVGDIEAFVPVASAFEPPAGIAVKWLEGAHVVSTVHRGPYQEVGAAYEALGAWMQEHGRVAVGPPRELYLNDPTEVGYDETLTEVDWPVAVPG